MKEYLHTILTTVAIGFFLAFSAMLGVFLFEETFANDQSQKGLNTVPYYDVVDSFSVLDVERIEETVKYTVVGKIKNGSVHKWNQVGVIVKVFAGNSVMAKCVETHAVRNIKPATTKAFLVECKDVDGTGLPDNIRHEVIVNFAAR